MKKTLITAATIAALMASTGLAFADDTSASSTSAMTTTATVTTQNVTAASLKSEIIQLIEQVLVLMNQELSAAQSGAMTSTTAVDANVSATGAVSITCANQPVATQSTSTPWAMAAANACAASSTTTTTTTTY